MKKRLCFLLAVLVLLPVLPLSVSAEETVCGKYRAVSCRADGNSYNCSRDYLLLTEEGGEIYLNEFLNPITWTLEGDVFSFTDDRGNQLTDGVLKDGVISGSYLGYELVFETVKREVPVSDMPDDGFTGITLYPASCLSDGSDVSVNGEYLILNADGTGMVVFQTCAYGLNWETGEDGTFRFTDSKENLFSGEFRDGMTITGSYRGYDYVYRLGANAPILSLSRGTWAADLSPVTDQADILTDGEERKLAEKAEEIAGRFGCSVYIVTLDDMKNFSLTGSKGGWDENGLFFLEYASGGYRELSPVETCAEEIRTGYDLGRQHGGNCVLLLLSMEDRDYDLMAYGSFGNASFTDYGKDYMEERFLDDFRDNDWFEGFFDYLACCEKLLALSAEGHPLDVGSQPANKILSAALSLLIALLVSLIVCVILKRGMKSAAANTTAERYVAQNGVDIAVRYDRFTHATETRVYEPRDRSGGGGGGGGTSFSSSGHSHSSGKF